MSRQELALFVRGSTSPVWKWISRHPHPYILVVALGAGVMAWFAGHSVWSVLGSALIAAGLAHLVGDIIGISVVVGLPVQWLMPFVLGGKADFQPVGLKFWLWFLMVLPVIACGLGIFFGGAMLVGTLTERALDEPGEENQYNALKPVSWLILSVLIAALVVGFVFLCHGI